MTRDADDQRKVQANSLRKYYGHCVHTIHNTRWPNSQVQSLLRHNSRHFHREETELMERAEQRKELGHTTRLTSTAKGSLEFFE